MIKDVYLADDINDYDKLGLQKNVELWEDSMRTTGKNNSFEWWYFDSEFSNGYKIVVIFYSKDRFDFYGPSAPMVSIDITTPDGNTITDLFISKDESSINYSNEKCDIKIGKSFIRYCEDFYLITYKNDDIELDIKLEPLTPMWRPGTGHIYFDSKFFAWLVAVPYGKSTGTLKLNDLRMDLEGTGYHDHNWGNADMSKLISNWYWCRAHIDSYTIVLFDIIAKDKFTSSNIPLLLLCKNNSIMNDNISSYSISKIKPETNILTKKTLHNLISVSIADKNNTVYNFSFHRDHDIQGGSLLKAFGVRFINKLTHKLKCFKPTYLRSVGIVTLSINSHYTYDKESLWEQMYFS